MKIDNDCPTHGKSERALERFWKNPYTCHWACKCAGIGRTEPIDSPTKEENK